MYRTIECKIIEQNVFLTVTVKKFFVAAMIEKYYVLTVKFSTMDNISFHPNGRTNWNAPVDREETQPRTTWRPPTRQSVPWLFTMSLNLMQIKNSLFCRTVSLFEGVSHAQLGLWSCDQWHNVLSCLSSSQQSLFGRSVKALTACSEQTKHARFWMSHSKFSTSAFAEQRSQVSFLIVNASLC